MSFFDVTITFKQGQFANHVLRKPLLSDISTHLDIFYLHLIRFV